MPLPKRPFIFVRHGQTDWNVEGRLQGHTDIPLNSEGLRQAGTICKTLLSSQVDYVISSPLIRALKTAAFIAETHQRPIHIDSRLQERTYGIYEGRLNAEVRKKLDIPLNESVTTHIDDVGEPWPDMTARITAAVSDWLKKHPKKKLVFVSHGAVFRALAEVLVHKNFKADNAQPYLFKPGKSGWEIIPL